MSSNHAEMNRVQCQSAPDYGCGTIITVGNPSLDGMVVVLRVYTRVLD